MDPKVKNLIKFTLSTVVFPILVLIAIVKYFGINDYFRLFGILTLIVLIIRISYSIYHRMIVPPVNPLDLGKWAIITGSTSGIGKEFANHLAKLGLNILIISRSENKLQEQVKELENEHKVKAKYLAYDFSVAGEARTNFYKKLDEELQFMQENGGISLLINNVGTANEIPKTIDEFTDEDIDNMIQCNIYSTVFMTRAVFKFMKPRRKGIFEFANE